MPKRRDKTEPCHTIWRSICWWFGLLFFVFADFYSGPWRDSTEQSSIFHFHILPQGDAVSLLYAPFQRGLMAAGFSAHTLNCRSKFVAKFVAICKWLCCKRVNDIQVVPTLGPEEWRDWTGAQYSHPPLTYFFFETWACSTLLLAFIYSLHDRKNTGQRRRGDAITLRCYVYFCF